MTRQKIIAFFDHVSFLLMAASAAVMLLVVDLRLADAYTLPKIYALAALVMAVLILQAICLAISRRFTYGQSVADMAILFLLAAAFLSAIFSINRLDSFLGRSDFFVASFVFLVCLAFLYILLVNILTTRRRWISLIDVFLVSGALTAIYFIIKSKFDFDILGRAEIWNPLDRFNSMFGLGMAVMFVISAGRIMVKSGAVRTIFNFMLALIFLTAIFVLNFKILWWLTLVGIAGLIAAGIVLREKARLWWLSALFGVFLAIGLFMIFGAPNAWQQALPPEISLGVRPSWSVGYKSLLSGPKNFFVGSGLGEFGYDFSRFRSADFNYSDIALGLRFGAPHNTLAALVSEGGVLLPLAMILLFLLGWGYVLQGMRSFAPSPSQGEGRVRLAEVEDANASASQPTATPLQSPLERGTREADSLRLDVAILAVAWTVLTIGFGTHFLGPVMWWLWFALLALIVSGLALSGYPAIKVREWSLQNNPQYNLAFSFSLIFFTALFIVSAVSGGRIYAAELWFGRATRESNNEIALTRTQKAVSLYGKRDIYHVALARLYLQSAGEESKKENSNLQKVGELVGKAVNEARIATELSPRSVGLLENLAAMYENAAALTPEAKDWITRTLTQAVELEPSNAYLRWWLGNSYRLSANNDKAAENYRQAIELKRDYLGAYLSLASVQADKGDVPSAIQTYESSFSQGGANNPDLLFNYGMTLYNRNSGDDRNKAEEAWARAVQIMPNYSNALYGLGMLYEFRGDRAKALQYYNEVKRLNPENEDIVEKIDSLTERKNK